MYNILTLIVFIILPLILCIYAIHEVYRRKHREILFDNWRDIHTEKLLSIKEQLEKGV